MGGRVGVRWAGTVHQSMAVLVATVAVVSMATGCAGARSDPESAASAPHEDSTMTTSDLESGPPGTYTSWKETFVDPSRQTPAGSQTPPADSRSLTTTIYLPDGPGPFPLIVFSHGLWGHPDKFSGLLSAWAAAGYVVAAPAFPLTNSEVPGAPQNAGDLAQQPADVSFVLDSVLEAGADPTSPLHGRIDPDRVGAAGLSLGGATTYAVVFGTSGRDERVKASEVLAGAILPATGPVVLDGHVPLLIVHGDHDPALDHRRFAESAYAGATGPVWFVTLLGAGHAAPFVNGPTPYDATVAALTVAFWDATIGSRPGELTSFERVASVDGLTTLEHK